MKSRSRSNILLVEILIAIMFFMLSSTVLVRLFATARSLSLRSGAEVAALAEAQNVAETLLAAPEPDAALAELGFVSAHGAWTRAYDDFTLMVENGAEAAGEGEMRTGEVRAFYGRDEELFALPYARYWEVRS